MEPKPWLLPNPDVVFQALGGEVVLVNLKTNRIYALNRTGARLWELLTGGSSRQEIRAELLLEFDVGEKELDEELDQMVASFARERLIA